MLAAPLSVRNRPSYLSTIRQRRQVGKRWHHIGAIGFARIPEDVIHRYVTKGRSVAEGSPFRANAGWLLESLVADVTKGADLRLSVNPFYPLPEALSFLIRYCIKAATGESQSSSP